MSETQDIYQVICEMKENECLWNLRHPQFMNTEKKNEILQKISDERGITVQRIKDIIKYVKREFNKQARVYETRSGDGAEDKVLSKEWKWFKECTFLKAGKAVNKTVIETDECFEGKQANTDEDQPRDQRSNPVRRAGKLRLITPTPPEFLTPSKHPTPAGYYSRYDFSTSSSMSASPPIFKRTLSVSPPVSNQFLPVSPSAFNRDSSESPPVFNRASSVAPLGPPPGVPPPGALIGMLASDEKLQNAPDQQREKRSEKKQISRGTEVSPERLRCPTTRDYQTESPPPTILLPPEIVEQNQQHLVRSLLCSLEYNLYELNPSAEELYCLHSDLIRFINGYFEMKRFNYLPPRPPRDS